MSKYPQSGSLLRRVVQRLYVARMGRASYGVCLGLAGVFAVLLLVSRLTGLIPDWFSLPTIVMLPLLALLGAAAFLRRPSSADAARRVDTYEGTKDLFLTLTMIDSAAGEYKPLVARDAEAQAPSVEPTSVVPWRWTRRTFHVAAALGVLLVGSLFLPVLDPFGKVAEAKEAEIRQEELAKSRKATEVRKSQLSKADLDSKMSEDVEQSLEELKSSLQRMEPQQRQENARVLAANQKALGRKWRLGAEQLKHLLSQQPMKQRFGDGTQSKARKWAKNLREGSTEELEQELDDLMKEIENIAQLDDPLKRTEAMRRLLKKLDDLKDFASEDVNSKPLVAALERAMQELEAAKSEKMSKAQMEAIFESIKLADLELKQLAQSARDMQELEKALEVMQMAKRLNNDEQLDGEMAEGAETMEDYAELYAEMMAELGYDVAAMGGEGLGAGEIEAMADDDSIETDFQDETSKSAIKKGKILLSLKTKGVTEDEDENFELQYNAIVSELKQSVSEVIEQEQIPPGYHDGIKKYFDSLDKTSPDGGP